MKLTKRQSEVLDCIRNHIDATGYPPTRADIARELGFRSANAAEEHLKALARKGAIEIIPGTSRGIRLPEEPESAPSGLPIVGQVAAGEPILAQQHIDEYCTIGSEFFHPKADYLLRVRGMSMKNIGILHADILPRFQHVKMRPAPDRADPPPRTQHRPRRRPCGCCRAHPPDRRLAASHPARRR